jgi:mRNA interferase HigB
MKVHLIKKKSIEDFVTGNAKSRLPCDDWLNKLKYADWAQPEHIKATFGSADLLGNGTSRVVFNIGGNNYRLIAKYIFGQKHVHLFVCWIGTHSDYTALCKNNGQYTVNQF